MSRSVCCLVCLSLVHVDFAAIAVLTTTIFFFPLFVVLGMLRWYTSCFDLIYQLLYLMVLTFDSSSWHPGIILFLVSLFSVYGPGFARFGVLLQLSRIAKLIAGKFLNDLKQLKPFKESSVDWRHSLFRAFDKNKVISLLCVTPRFKICRTCRKSKNFTVKSITFISMSYWTACWLPSIAVSVLSHKIFGQIYCLLLTL